MIITCKAPFRISFFGGGTDYEYFIKEKVFGSTLSCTINKYIYVNICQNYKKEFKLNYSKQEKVKKIKDIKHKYIRKALEFLNVKNGIEISINADLPHGLGLSSSSALASCLLLGLKKFKREKLQFTWKDIQQFEKKIIKNNCGFQDQYIINRGGLRNVKFFKKKVIDQKIFLSKKKIEFFKNNVILINTGIKRNYDKVTIDQKKNLKKNYTNLIKMREICSVATNYLKKNKFKEFGLLLQKNWEIKKKLSKEIFKNKNLKKLEKKIMKTKIWGMKLLGAGGGGVILVCGTKKTIKKISKFKNYETYKILPTESKTKILSIND